MDTRFLESFIEVADRGSLAEAARRLNLTPAAVAQRIAVLEQDIGIPLIARAGRVVRPTTAGLAILERAKSFLRDVRDLRSIAVGQMLVGQFRLGSITTALTGYMPGLLKAFMTEHPAVEIFIEPGTSMNLYQKVMDASLDAAIIVQPGFTLPKGLVFRPIRSEPLVVIAPAGIGSDDPNLLLSREPLIRYDRQHWGGRLADDYLRAAAIRPRERLELDSLEAIAVMVDRGLGISLVPDWAPPWPAALNLVKIPLKGHAPVRVIGAVWPHASLRATIAHALFNPPTS